MSSRPLWNRFEDPGLLLRFVEAGTAAALLSTFPTRAAGAGPGPLERARAVYNAFATAGIRYADESVDSGDGWQEIRGASAVLRPPGLANCVDLAVTFSGACLDAGVHPLIVVIDPVAGGPSHAIVVVWLGGPWSGTGGDAGYREFEPDLTPPLAWPHGLRRELLGRGAFLPIDVAQLASHDPEARRDVSLEAAVRAGATYLESEAWRVTIALDVGLRYDPRGTIVAEPRELTAIKSHSEMIAGLDGFRRNLLNSNLPYVPPTDPHDPSAPQRLLARLGDETGPPGVLLVGAAGVGKTRACFEVANQAVRDGWAVLHVTAGESAVTAIDLHEAIVGTRAERVLVVLDYLNEYRIDLAALRHRVVPDAARHDTRVALIASCRPGWHSTTDAPLDLLFEVVELEPPESRLSAIRDQILRLVAPNAVEDVGMDRMREACGSRPVIAMLIASEAERLCARNELTAALAHVRSEDLLGWLKRRLREDRLIPKPAQNPFVDDEDEPSLKLQACVAMLLASPQDEESLIACALNVAGLPTNHADSVLRRLRAMKWVVTGPGGLVPVHDLVTDQLVENILLDNGQDAVRTAAAERVLDACLVTGRSVGRFANNLNRIIRDMPQRKAGPLREHCGTWLAAKARAAGEVLARTNDEGAYAIGALLDNPAWSPVGFDSWDLVVGPWLRHYPDSLSARHLLYKGLRTISDRADDRLLGESLMWLSQHGTHLDAGFVLGPLLGRELDTTTAANAVAHALTWLDEHGTHIDAQFVLNSLLGRELETTAATRAVTHALAWLDEHGTHIEARFVLSWLLGRELDTTAATRTLNHTFTWLDKYRARIEARFVLNPLLGRELDTIAATNAVTYALTWLDEHGTHVGVGFVLGRLLGRELDTTAETKALNHTFTWLDEHRTHIDARFVLGRLFGREFDTGAAIDPVTAAFAWLDEHGTHIDAQFVLNSLLGRELDTTTATRAVPYAFAWLDEHGTHIAARFVLGPLLGRELDTTTANRAVAHAITWLDEHHSHLDAGFVLNPLLSRELDTTTATRAVTYTFTWLDEHGTHLDAGFVLGRLLSRELDTTTATRAVTYTFTWLDEHGTHLEAGFVLGRLLSRELDTTTATRAVTYAFTWLDEHGTHLDAQFVLGRLLPLTLDRDRRRRVVALSLAWIESNGAGSDLVSKFMSRQREITEPVAAALIRWAGDNPNDEDMGWRLAGVAKGLPGWPHLAVPLLTVVERALWALPIEPSGLNSQSEMDGLIRYLCMSAALSSGIAGARVDDLLRLWLARPESLSPNCSPGTHFLELTSRVTSFFIVPGNAPPGAVEMLDRIEAWVHQWQVPDGDDMRTAALDCILRARKFVGQAG